jgi:hypothetical protein
VPGITLVLWLKLNKDVIYYDEEDQRLALGYTNFEMLMTLE